MENNFLAKASATINAPMDKVWQALTDPKMVKEWLFGTDMHVDNWEVGGEITYTGQWEGKQYQDKGKIVEIMPGQKLVSTYWSSFSGLPDAPENYSVIKFNLSPEETQTAVTLTISNFPIET